MMNSMIKENRLSFKDLEKNIYGFICQLGRDITKNLLEEYDRELMQARDRKRYRHKGTRRTTVKTLYGEAEYERAVYQVKEEDGTKRHVFLLDEELGMSLTGLVSANMAECMVKGITEMSYRQCAEKVSEMTGQSISAMGVWNVIQSLGEKACEEEEELSEANKKGQLKGKVETPVIFEESDGVYLKLQGKDRKKSVQGKAELKVGIAYSGWRQTGKERYELQDRTAVAGFFSAKEFHEHREAVIASVFNLDEADQRILNADGASWIKKVKDQDTCFQLDPFHRNKAAREKLHDQKAYRDVMDLLKKKEIGEVFRYLELYRDSLSDEDEIKDVQELIKYYENNRGGLLTYREQGIRLPEAEEGVEYRNMGTMEGHVWSIIAKRMKHNHTCWSRRGGNHLAKILAKKFSGKLDEVIERFEMPVFEEEKLEEAVGKVLSAGQVAERIGKGYAYPVFGHLVRLGAKTAGDGTWAPGMAGY